MTGQERLKIESMIEKNFYADVDLPFHVWMREGSRWVLREAPGLREDASRSEAPIPSGPTPARSSRRKASRR